jgi:hypothetical protein
MKNKYLLITVIFFAFTFNASAQFLTQSADGQSSIPLPLNGIGVGVDIAKTEVVMGLNNYEKVLRSRSKDFKDNILIGLNLSAKNEDGFANLFSSGGIVPGASALGFLGYSVSNNDQLLRNYKNSEAYNISQSTSQRKNAYFNEYKEAVLGSINSQSDKIKNDSLKIITREELSNLIQTDDNPDAIKNTIENYEINVKELDGFRSALEKDNTAALTIYSKKYLDLISEKTQALKGKFNEYLNSQWPVRVTLFILGGINARSFTRFLGANPTDFLKSFQDTLFQGNKIGIGVNIQVRNYWLGATYSYLKRDNFINLTRYEYTLQTVNTSGNQLLKQETKVTAYSGKYAVVNIYELNLDLVRDFRISDSSRLLANLFFRGSLFSRNKAILTNYTNIGTGLYFIGKKSKFLGGLYVELPDINNNLEKANPGTRITSPLKKLTFGIVTKFNISSLFNWTNRPEEPRL